MSTYSSAFTGYAPGGFHLDHPTRNLDATTSILNPGKVRTHLETEDGASTHYLTTTEAREFAIRLLICVDTPRHLIEPLLALQETDADAPLDTDL
jgi:hypothetical protein